MNSVVYFIQAPDGLVKIGTTRDIDQRLKALQAARGDCLALIGTIPGGIKIEREFHKRWAGQRVSGEWFAATDQMLHDIRSEIDAPKLPLVTAAQPKKPQSEGQSSRLIAFLKAVHPENTVNCVAAELGAHPDTVKKWLSGSGLPSGFVFSQMIEVYGPRFLAATWPESEVPLWVDEAIGFVDAEHALIDLADAMSRFREALPRTNDLARVDFIRKFNDFAGRECRELPIDSVDLSLSEPRQ